MEKILAIFTNHILIAATFSWLICQISKFIITAIVEKQWRFERLVGDGGMPSGHSATVSSLAAIICLMQGPDSVAFAISAILAIIVCHDATGVRMETGKQAKLLNQIVAELFTTKDEKRFQSDLKELLGHTPLQVFVGAVLGAISALLLYPAFH